MKIIILLLTINFLSFNAHINAQCNLSNERKQEIIDSLNSTNYWHRSDALEIIWDCKIIEAKAIIEDRFWELGSEYISLDALYKLGSGLTHQFASAYYDTIQKKIDQVHLTVDSNLVDWYKHAYLEDQVGVIEVLFKLGDFSKADKVIELLDSDPEPPKNSYALSALAFMINGTPQYRERAINEFENAVQSDAYSGWDRLNFLYILRENLGQETFPIAYTIFLQDTDQAVRRSVLGMLPSYTNEDVPGLLKERLLVEPDQSIAGSIIGSLLYYYGTPSNYNYIKEFAQNNPDHDFKHDILISLRLFEPYKPDTTSQVDLIRMLDTLQSFSQQCLSFNWVDAVLQAEISSKIQNAKTYLSTEDSVNCAKEIKALKEKIDFEYKDTLNTTPEFVTREGWQFLYYIPQYILDRLPTPPVVVEINLNEITPAMSMKNHPGAFTMELTGSGFSSSSVVYFNGNAKATTYVSDTILNAEILESDVSATGNFPVWVSDGTTNSDTIMFSVVDNLPQEILPVMNCVTNNGDGTYTAYFGYDNQNSAGVFIPVYAQNKISPEPWDRGQPGVFKVGVQERVFSVTWSNGNIIWHLNNNTATAKTNSPPCE